MKHHFPKFDALYWRIIEESIHFFDSAIYHNFFIELSKYQSNHFGTYNTEHLYKEYMSLPENFKKIMAIPKSQYKNCFRGDDGKNEKLVTSFVYNKNAEIAKRNASFTEILFFL